MWNCCSPHIMAYGSEMDILMFLIEMVRRLYTFLCIYHLNVSVSWCNTHTHTKSILFLYGICRLHTFYGTICFHSHPVIYVYKYIRLHNVDFHLTFIAAACTYGIHMGYVWQICETRESSKTYTFRLIKQWQYQNKRQSFSIFTISGWWTIAQATRCPPQFHMKSLWRML